MSLGKCILLTFSIIVVLILMMQWARDSARERCLRKYPEAVECIVVSGGYGLEGIPIIR